MHTKTEYNRFIENRLENHPPENSYTEKHHIIPKCVGGSNNPENIISLIAEDHFLAHYILAQIYGGKCIGALRIMASRAYGKDKVKFKDIRSDFCNVARLYADAKKLLNKEFRGKVTPRYDSTVYSFIHKDGTVENCTKNKLCLKYSLDVRNLFGVIHGDRKSIKGWTTKAKAESKGFYWGLPTGKNHPGSDRKKYQFKHKDGAVFVGTRSDFYKETGVPQQQVKSLIENKLWQTYGWYLSTRFDSFPTKTKMHNKTAKQFTLKHMTGKEVIGTRIQLQKIVGCGSGEISNLLNGKNKSARGWMLPGTDPKVINITGKPPIKISKIYGTVYHSEKGVFTGNGTEFRLQMEPENKRATEAFGELIRGREKSWKGWRVNH